MSNTTYTPGTEHLAVTNKPAPEQAPYGVSIEVVPDAIDATEIALARICADIAMRAAAAPAIAPCASETEEA